jgi:alpha-glucosidase
MAFPKQLLQKWKSFKSWLFYLGYAPHAYVYSRTRDRLEREYAPPPTSEGFDQPGKLLQAESSERGARFYFEQAELDITFLTADLVRLSWQPGIPPVPYAIARHEWDKVETTLEETTEGWALSSQGEGATKVTVSFEGSITFYGSEGQLLRTELPPKLEGEAWIHQAELLPDEGIYGLGERAAPLNLRVPRKIVEKDKTTFSRSYRMWNFDAAGKYSPGSDPLYICIPVYLGLHRQGSYLVFYENTFEATFSFEDTATAAFTGGALRYYFAAGTPDQLVERYTELTGRSPLPPRWALGYHQSRWGYETEEAVRVTAKGFQDHDLPLSAIHLDIDVQVDYRAFTIDPDRFPKLPEFIKELGELGVQFIAILNPGIKYSRKSHLFLEGRLLDAFCKYPDGEIAIAPVWPGLTVFPDYTNPAVRKWWSRQYAYLLDVGVAGFWHDMNEPAAFVAWGDRSLPKPMLHYMEGRGGTHLEAHNVYGLMQSKAGYESLCQNQPHQRPFIVSRAGWAGLQRYAWTWTGDIEGSWEALRQTISTVVGLGLSGVPYSGPDIGGFQGNPSAELYLRWFQMSTFLTFYRTHSSVEADHRTPWTYGEPTLSTIRELLKLRYRLMPYFYTLAWQASQKGYAPVRPLFWADPSDPNLWGVEDAFLLGDNLLVCPILEEGGRSRQVTLPKGNWYDFWNDNLLEGATEVSLDAPLDTIPVLVKAGSILPMEEYQQLTLHLYPPAQGSCETSVYSDAGDGYGEWRLDHFQLVRFEHGIDLVWHEEGGFPFPYTSIQLQVHGFELQQVWVDDVEVECEGNQWKGDRFQKIYLKGK